MGSQFYLIEISLRFAKEQNIHLLSKEKSFFLTKQGIDSANIGKRGKSTRKDSDKKRSNNSASESL